MLQNTMVIKQGITEGQVITVYLQQRAAADAPVMFRRRATEGRVTGIYIIRYS